MNPTAFNYEKYEALLKRFKHLLESDTIAEFDRVNRNGVYSKDIHAFDGYVKACRRRSWS